MTSPQNSRVRYTLGGPLTPVVRTLIFINVAAYLLMMLSSVHPNEIYNLLGLRPAMVVERFAFWQVITYMFIHDSGIWHILFNMLVLWWFGCDIERSWGPRLFLRFYLLAGVAAALTVIGFSWDSYNITIGASGAMMAILLAYGMSYPERTILFMFVIPMRAKYFVLIIALVELWSSARAFQDNVSHVAHLGGLAFGLLWFLYHSRRLDFGQLRRAFKRRKRRGRLRLVKNGQNAPDDEEEDQGPTIH